MLLHHSALEPVTPNRITLGLDLGTSGIRAAVVQPDGEVIARSRLDWPHGIMPDAPEEWWLHARNVLREAIEKAGTVHIDAVAVDGTSGTVLWCADDGQPLTPAFGYDQPVAADSIQRIAAIAPAASGAHGSGSGLARALQLAHPGLPANARLRTQTDWITGCLLGDWRQGDENNALKLGYDPVDRSWPDWLSAIPVPRSALARCHPPGADLGAMAPQVAATLGVPGSCRIVAGTTDSIAGTLAAGIRAEGDAVTSLGTTLALKLLTSRAVFAPEYGIYSHRLGLRFLAGGASNCGAGILSRFFSADRLASLSRQIDADRDSGLDYYPLLRPGERFPRNDPDLQPRLTPRPESDVHFLHGLLEGIARVEAEGYRRLHELGATWPRRVLSVGGGADNPAWLRIRGRYLQVPVQAAADGEAAVGAARLAQGRLRDGDVGVAP